MSKVCKGFCQTVDNKKPIKGKRYELGWRYCRTCRFWWQKEQLVNNAPKIKSHIICACCTSLVRQKARIYGWRKEHGYNNNPN